MRLLYPNQIQLEGLVSTGSSPSSVWGGALEALAFTMFIWDKIQYFVALQC